MHVNDLSDDQRMAVRAKLKDPLDLALEMDRNLPDAWRRDFDAGDRGETGYAELGIIGREGIGRIHHFPPHLLGHHVEAEFAGLTRVLERMLVGAVGITRDRQRDHRWNDADHGEKRKRRKISDAALTECRCPADRPWHDSPGQESVNLTLFDSCGIEFEIIGHLVRSHSVTERILDFITALDPTAICAALLKSRQGALQFPDHPWQKRSMRRVASA